MMPACTSRTPGGKYNFDSKISFNKTLALSLAVPSKPVSRLDSGVLGSRPWEIHVNKLLRIYVQIFMPRRLMKQMTMRVIK